MFGLVPKVQQKVLSYKFWPNFVRLQLESQSGPFTVFFWAPFIKSGIVLANSNDFKKPVEQISTKLQCVLFMSGLLWTRWCFIVTPQLYALASINFLMANTALYQIYRKYQAGQLLE